MNQTENSPKISNETKEGGEIRENKESKEYKNHEGLKPLEREELSVSKKHKKLFDKDTGKISILCRLSNTCLGTCSLYIDEYDILTTDDGYILSGDAYEHIYDGQINKLSRDDKRNMLLVGTNGIFTYSGNDSNNKWTRDEEASKLAPVSTNCIYDSKHGWFVCGTKSILQRPEILQLPEILQRPPLISEEGQWRILFTDNINPIRDFALSGDRLYVLTSRSLYSINLIDGIIKDINSNLLRQMLIPMSIKVIGTGSGDSTIFISGGHVSSYQGFSCNLLMMTPNSGSFVEYDISHKGFQLINDLLPIKRDGREAREAREEKGSLLDLYIVGVKHKGVGISMAEITPDTGTKWNDMVHDENVDPEILYRIIKKNNTITATGRGCMYISDLNSGDQIKFHRQTLENMNITDICIPYIHVFDTKSGLIDTEISTLKAKRGDVLCIECTDDCYMKIQEI